MNNGESARTAQRYDWFPFPGRFRGQRTWAARFRCGHHAIFSRRPMIEANLRYGCTWCGWQHIEALCEIA